MTGPDSGIAQNAAPQHDQSAARHGPRPLPLFLAMLREQTAASPDRRAAALAGLRRYQEAPRMRYRPAPARYRKGAARLRDHGRGVPEGAPPVVFVPSLINPPFVLDLAPGRSLIAHVAAAGFHPWLVDWGYPRARDGALDLGGHVAQRLLPLLAKLDRPPLLVGYCLGGTLALAAAALAGTGTGTGTGAGAGAGTRARVAGVATIAAPWRFAGYGTRARAAAAALWRDAEPAARALGLLPMEVLQTAFWRLDPARTIAKYEAFATMPAPQAAAFVALEDWANAGAPLTYGAGAELFGALLAEDRSGRGCWRAGGHAIDPHALACPAAEFVSLTDRIVPAATAIGLPARHDVAAGHVGMVVGARARHGLWEPLTTWLKAGLK